MNTEPAPSRSPAASQGKPLRAVIFDYGGVLTSIPTEEDWRKMAAMLDTPLAVFLEGYWGHRYPYEIRGYDSGTYWGLVARTCGKRITPRMVRELVDLDNEQWGKANLETIALARQLRSSGMPTALLSNMQPDMLAFVRGKHTWLKEFEVRLFSCEVGEAKPEPGIFLHAAHLLQLQPEDCLFVDDREENLAGARRVGMQTMHFVSSQSIAALRQRLSEAGIEFAVTT